MTSVRRFTVTETREAMEVTAGNLEEVAAWCGGIACSRYVSYIPSRTEGADKAWVGTVLVTDGAEWWTLERGEFERNPMTHWDQERDPLSSWTEETT